MHPNRCQVDLLFTFHQGGAVTITNLTHGSEHTYTNAQGAVSGFRLLLRQMTVITRRGLPPELRANVERVWLRILRSRAPDLAWAIDRPRERLQLDSAAPSREFERKLVVAQDKRPPFNRQRLTAAKEDRADDGGE